MSIITRFAPSPTGFLHIGGARTALFNWLYSKNNQGKFLLRIEDTDKKRSTQEAIDSIIASMEWLNLCWDDHIVFQSQNIKRHQQIVQQLLADNKAYYCYCPSKELSEIIEQTTNNKSNLIEPCPCRELSMHNNHSANRLSAVRLKMPLQGKTIIDDIVQGTITINNNNLDDLILQRSDGTPTYMLSVVIDDHDMNVTDIIRGDDHLTNCFKQKKIYEALAWEMPRVCHIPMIHGNDGKKLSKRHGALGVQAYQDMGVLPEALCNYLLRLGWSHQNDEIISQEQAIQWFNLQSIGKSPARFDMDKLLNINSIYIRNKPINELLELIQAKLLLTIKRTITPAEINNIMQGINGLKERAKDLCELAANAQIYLVNFDITLNEKAQKILTDESLIILKDLIEKLEKIDYNSWSQENIKHCLKNFATQMPVKLVNIAQPLRVALTGSNVSPSIFEIMAIIGQQETVYRIKKVLNGQS